MISQQLVRSQIIELALMKLRHVKLNLINPAYHTEKENELSVLLAILTVVKSQIS